LATIEIKVFSLRLALKTPFRIAHGTYEYRENVFIRLQKDGCFGYGEAPIVPYYGLTVEQVQTDIQNTLKRCNPEYLEDLLVAKGTGQELQFAFFVSSCAFLSAILNLQGALGRGRISAKAMESIPQTSFTLAYEDTIEDMVERAKNCGFQRLKVKAGIPGDIERISRIKEALPNALLRIDANQGWSLIEAPGKIAALERIGIEFLEEPIKGTPAQIESLAQGTSVPIVLDESVKHPGDLLSFIAEAPHVSGIVVKIAKSGGPQATLDLIETAKQARWNIMLSCMVESSVGISSALPLAPHCSWLDLDAPLLLAEDPFHGLLYTKERPTLQTEGLIPSKSLCEYMDTIPPLRIKG
jgi:L-alanine-DL-glutamate epimerase-like enolase superfamily enzyme